MSNTVYAWFYFSDKSSLDERIARVKESYRVKHREFPTVCLVSQSEFDGRESIGEVNIRPSLTVQPDNYLVGVE